MKKKMIKSWGRYPFVKNKVTAFESNYQASSLIKSGEELIACGNVRSYGDSALSKNIIDLRPLDLFLDFNDETGELHVQSGVILADILECFIPKGWFLNVVPGTKLITIGGAIASDVHGKNHHIDGCFSQSVKELSLMDANGEIKQCSKDKLKTLFRATCGGQGLTGIILDVKIILKRISSTEINQTTIKTGSLKATFDAFKKLNNHQYSVAWIDCLAKEKNIGRGIVQAGDFEQKTNSTGGLNYMIKKRKNLPFNFPSFIINNWTVRAFNLLYYWFPKNGESRKNVDIDSFFFPLDAIGNWNRIYGQKGFVQYQFILPLTDSFRGMSEILKKISQSQSASFLAVLKLYGKENENYLSFPMEGYSLAVDFKLTNKTLGLLKKLDKIVSKYDGRIYLAKDARVSKEIFEKGYPQIEKFRKIRIQQGMDKIFQSAQSKRLEL